MSNPPYPVDSARWQSRLFTSMPYTLTQDGLSSHLQSSLLYGPQYGIGCVAMFSPPCLRERVMAEIMQPLLALRDLFAAQVV